MTSVIIVLGILVAVNYLASRRNWRWDLTANRQFSLSDQTRQILRSLDAPVQVLVFERPDRFDAFRDRLAEYEHVSNGRLTVEYVNPDREPARANQNQVQSYGTVVFRYGDRTERVVGSDEQQLTNALIRSCSGEQPTVYFLEGHGEREITSSANDGYATINQALGSENYVTQPLALAQQGGCRRRVGAGRRAADDRPAAAGGRRHPAVPRPRRQAVRAARTAPARCAADART
jgi:ABC-type uncharacterized transport system involved in gliding motility auxiliary subunit